MSHAVPFNRHTSLLVEHLEQLWVAGGYPSMRAFCKAIGFDQERVSNWKTAKGDPELSTLVTLAECLNISLGQLLVIADYGTPEQLCGATPPPITAAPATLEQLIKASGFTDEQEHHLLGLVRLFQEANTPKPRPRRQTRT